jgi:hypothetical protein
MGEPQREQKARSLPGDDSYSRSVSAPASRRKRARSTGALAACAEPLALRQLLQWQILGDVVGVRG